MPFLGLVPLLLGFGNSISVISSVFVHLRVRSPPCTCKWATASRMYSAHHKCSVIHLDLFSPRAGLGGGRLNRMGCDCPSLHAYGTRTCSKVALSFSWRTVEVLPFRKSVRKLWAGWCWKIRWAFELCSLQLSTIGLLGQAGLIQLLQGSFCGLNYWLSGHCNGSRLGQRGGEWWQTAGQAILPHAATLHLKQVRTNPCNTPGELWAEMDGRLSPSSCSWLLKIKCSINEADWRSIWQSTLSPTGVRARTFQQCFLEWRMGLLQPLYM